MASNFKIWSFPPTGDGKYIKSVSLPEPHLVMIRWTTGTGCVAGALGLACFSRFPTILQVNYSQLSYRFSYYNFLSGSLESTWRRSKLWNLSLCKKKSFVSSSHDFSIIWWLQNSRISYTISILGNYIQFLIQSVDSRWGSWFVPN